MQNGVETLIIFMDNLFKKDALSEAYESHTQFDRFSRTPKMTMENFIIESEKCYNRTKKNCHGIT